jgi:hypothetical protein
MNALILWPTVTLALLLVLLAVWKPHDALVHNARVTLFATALNNLGVAAIIYGVIAPMLNRSAGDSALGFLARISHTDE